MCGSFDNPLGGSFSNCLGVEQADFVTFMSLVVTVLLFHIFCLEMSQQNNNFSFEFRQNVGQFAE
jgi:hypothetical protein